VDRCVPLFGGGGGYRLEASTGNIVTSNDVSRNGAFGVLLVDADSNAIRSNIVNDTGIGTIVFDTVSPLNGIFVLPATGIAVLGDSDRNSIHSNQTNRNQNGISLGCPTGCRFVQLPGIIPPAGLGAENNTILSNVANDNFELDIDACLDSDGIQIGVGNTNNRAQGNTALRNAGVDLRDDNPGCDANLWRSNIFVTDLVAGLSDGGPGAGCIR
jgi:parallel beta-helix repeat protein